jgi:hypothetical protein
MVAIVERMWAGEGTVAGDLRGPLGPDRVVGWAALI